MNVNATHGDYDAGLPAWLRARDVLAGEDAVKAGGEKYLPRLDGQCDEDFESYRARAAFFNATARTADGYLGLVFRRPPFVKIPGNEPSKHANAANGGNETPAPQPSSTRERGSSALARAMGEFVNDADMQGTAVADYARNVVREVIAVGRCGTLVDWEGENENRVYAVMYQAEQILNWRVERINGRNMLAKIVLSENGEMLNLEEDESEEESIEQIRVLRLVVVKNGDTAERVPTKKEYQCLVEIWRRKKDATDTRDKNAWELVETRVPLRLGKPLPMIPFVFHGARHFMPDVDKLPLADVIAVNLDHYRLDADYKHGMHFTALPTAWVSGFDAGAVLKIGANVAWSTATVGATAGFLEYTGQGLTTFERAMDRDERLLAILGARLLETQKRVGETSEAIELRQSGENSILGSLAASVGTSLTHVLQWAYWWNSTEEWPDDVTKEQVCIELNTDFSTKGLSAQEIAAVVAAWQTGALSRDSMMELFRRGEVLPEGRTNEEEERLVKRAVISDQSSVTKKNANEAKKEPGMADGS